MNRNETDPTETMPSAAVGEAAGLAGPRHDGIEEERMQAAPTAASKTYRFTIDVRADLYAEPGDPTAPEGPTSTAHHRALVRELLARPEDLDRLLRSSAIGALAGAQKTLASRMWGSTSEQGLLRRAISALGPEVLGYLSEEVEDGAVLLLFDGYGASVRRLGVEEIGDEATGQANPDPQGIHTSPPGGSQPKGGATEGVYRNPARRPVRSRTDWVYDLTVSPEGVVTAFGPAMADREER